MLQGARVFLEMRAPDPDALAVRQREPAVDRQRQVVLRDLVALGKVGVHVVLAVELGVLGRLAVEREAGSDRELDGPPVWHRQRAREAEADRANERVGRRAEPLRFAAAEHLRLGLELDVGLDTDDDLVRARGLRGAGHGEGGAETRSGATINRLRLTITRSPLTDTRYLSRPRGPASREFPPASNVNSRPALASHEAV